LIWQRAGLADLPDLEKFLIRKEVECVGFSAWLKEKITSTPHLRNDFIVFIKRNKDHPAGDFSIGEAVLITEQGLVYPVIENRPAAHGLHELYHYFSQFPPRINSVIGLARSVDLFCNLVRRPVSTRVDYHLMSLEPPANDAPVSPLARDVRVRRATLKDVAPLYDLQRRYEIEEVCLDPSQFNETACYAHLKDSLRKEVIYLAERNGRAVAKSGTNACGYRVWQIGGVFTRPEARGQGIGTLLMRAIIDHAARNDKATCLFVKKTNPAAIALYKKLGYETVDGFRISYFKNGC